MSSRTCINHVPRIRMDSPLAARARSCCDLFVGVVPYPYIHTYIRKRALPLVNQSSIYTHALSSCAPASHESSEVHAVRMVHVVWACALLPWLAASVTPPADAPPMPPADDFCTPPFGDCRETLCCSDESQSCFRRPHVYFAQCRPHNSACGDGSADEWLCPGWEACVDEGDECAFSRCCKDDNHGCFLNRTLYAATGAWHAKCEPASVTRHASNNRLQLHTVAEGEALLDVDIIDSQNVTTDKFFYLEVASKVYGMLERAPHTCIHVHPLMCMACARPAPPPRWPSASRRTSKSARARGGTTPAPS